ncbi:MAG: response regulator [Nitrososphaera sp.]
MRILVAEDEPAIRMQYQAILEDRGHRVVATADGRECVEAYRAEQSSGKSGKPFDLVILDYRMPVLDGLGAAREILNLYPEQRIIFASAYVAETLRESAKDLHQIVELLQKPFGLDYLVEIVEDTEVYQQLESLNVRVRELRSHNLTLSQLVDLLAGVRKLQATVLSSH